METNKYITVAYKLYAIEDGERDFTEEATTEHPFQFISGLGLTLEAFENQLKDLNAGDKFDFTIACTEAYGEYDEDHVIDLPKDIFLIDGKFDETRIKEGAIVPLMTAEGQHINGSVVEVKDDVVVMDMNHPLAGCDLNFVGEVVTNRPATNEELAEMARMMSGGCGCSCDSCGGGCGDHDCGDDCGCEGGCCH
ncbi:FKBP-type peptidyl-prolyl cis-trans isomerase [Caecibacteroides pullorum]|uniref:Peptidyl-prolyl cis-trans isomerase n=1 Tax=Caecibacteroides pullorum TaxID=2725562 RepID=A0AA40ZVA7_9BACT|nr:FKBP-type peptidyl-prolyl cis-trans isomerase [Caecibacteroides pullorum]MBM6858713.1 FKBP-type peptidyl-prolyl cis-trans isomerase [Caecibacteroides pullorum]MBV8059738.1 peptidylprolyl isomerase [Caecibacteroides pullorum]